VNTIDDMSVRVEIETGNVRPLLHEIRHALARLAQDEEGTVIDLRSLPLAAGEEMRIEQALGEGQVRAELDALGPTIVQETSYSGVWLITHLNTDKEIVARFIEVTRMPDVLMSQTEDIQMGMERLFDALMREQQEKDTV
jgi:hydrogenase-1 operon protein HyaF